MTSKLIWYDSVAHRLATIIPAQAHAEAAQAAAQIGSQTVGVETGALQDDIASPKFSGPGLASIGSDLPYARRHNFEQNDFLTPIRTSFVGLMFLGLRKRYP